ncbi:MAG TPA: peptidylprolyl isomerase [Acidimicrobiales bacterium]
MNLLDRSVTPDAGASASRRVRHGRLIALVVAIAALAAACNNASPFAARVNGHTISADSVQSELAHIAGNEPYRAAIEASGLNVLGESDGTYDAAFAAQVLNRQILFQLVREELENLGAAVGADDLAAARANVAAQVGGDEVFAAFNDEYQESLAFRTAEVTVLQQALASAPTGPEAARSFYDENPDLFEQACAHHILVDSEEEASDVIARVEGGESFDDLAQELSIDTGSGAVGGDLGCAPRGVYVPEFEEAIFSGPVGELQDPVQSQFGFHVIRVDSREVPPFAEVEAEVQQQLATQGQDAFGTWLQEAVSNADVDVSPRFGSWSEGLAPSVVPPDAPQRPADPTPDLDPVTPIEP